MTHAYEQCRWFGGMVGNHVADMVTRYGTGGVVVPRTLTDYIAKREGYDHNEHGRAGAASAAFVPDEIVDRFCVIGTGEQPVTRLRELQELSVNQFAIYLQHDAQNEVLRAYGERILPVLTNRQHTRA